MGYNVNPSKTGRNVCINRFPKRDTTIMPVDTHLLNIIKLISNVTDAFTTALFISDDKHENLTLQAFYSLSKHVITNAHFGYGDGMVGWVAKNSKPIIVNQFDRDTKTLQFYSVDEDIKSFMAVPLTGGRGVLSVDSKQKYIFTEKGQKLLLGFSEVILHQLEVSGIEVKERLYDKVLNLQYQSDRVGQQARDFDDYLTNILVLCLSFTRAEIGFYASSESGDKYRLNTIIGTTKSLPGQQFSMEKGLSGWVFRNGKPLVLDKIRQTGQKTYLFSQDEPLRGFTAFLGIPCIFPHSKGMGVMGFVSYSPCTWEQEEIDALVSVGQKIILTKDVCGRQS